MNIEDRKIIEFDDGEEININIENWEELKSYFVNSKMVQEAAEKKFDEKKTVSSMAGIALGIALADKKGITKKTAKNLMED